MQRTEDDIIAAHYAQLAKNSPFTGGANRSGGITGAGLLPILFWCLLTFIGSEAVKVVFRKNFGKGSLRLDLIVVSSLIFAGTAIFAFQQSMLEYDSQRYTGTSDTNLVTGILYTVLFFYVLIVGVSCYRKSKKNRNRPERYQGDSYLLSPFFKGKWKEEHIQFYAEPLVVIAFGTAFCFVDFIAGIPLLFCGLSIWVREALMRYYLPKNTDETDVIASSSTTLTRKEVE